MTTEELIKYLKERNGKKATLKLQGIIDTKLKIEQMNIKVQEGYLYLQSENDISSSIKLNLHQLKKISKVEEKEILLEFDQLQNVTIIIQ